MSKHTPRGLPALSALEALSVHLEAVREGERKLIAMEMHDELGQLLTALRTEVLLLRQELLPDSIAAQKADEMKKLLDTIMGVVRSVVNQVRPAALDLGIVPALEWLADDFSRRTEISCRLSAVGPEPRLSEMRTAGIFRIVQESLTNVLRHASASHVEIRLTKSGSKIELVVRDNGKGFDMPVRRLGSYGLLGMAERARMMHAHLKIESRPGNGSVVELLVHEDGHSADG
ncbi:sensor histidine kinase [Paraburkholderia aspalathi]|uniref:Histidine kinase-, DNA gyrase B-, and HSP90-like ATPase n=1 Tax=Paraburkholderia aspalathi TaxID=1324617 RepID=A0A1I7B4R2_9BURK|nr:sensor histidine kinase [Paraburkholderia aspalathi]SFT82166.1 Histidine kinase-, DNA gyrase B-, and HSP90-like ATPase [Paraburkholderia aspalathi]